MGKRLLNCDASDFLKMNAKELKQAIAASEGRTVCSENVVIHEPVSSVTNAEVARAFGADLILLNVFDCLNPFILGMENKSIVDAVTDYKNKVSDKQVIQKLKKLVGRPIGVNLEPVDPHAKLGEEQATIAPGRQCSKETLQAAEELGFDFICLTGNPGTGVTNKEIHEAIVLAKQHFSGLIIAGKMHGAGVLEPVVPEQKVLESFIKAGADVILVPAVGTVPGFTDQELVEVVRFVKGKGALVLSAIGTSQESADPETIKQIAIRNKVAGVDIQHIGDAGYGGLAPAENIFALSVAIRGMRHTINMVSKSINR